MYCSRHILRLALAALAVVFLTSCGEPPVEGSDAALESTFHQQKERIMRLMSMAEKDHAEVLWLTTHELQPADTFLSPERWQQYDDAIEGTGIRRLQRRDRDVEMDIGAASNGFMQQGAKKGYMFSLTPLSPLVKSLDEGIPPQLADAGTHSVYKELAPNWYLFFRQE